jgi:hypothetical protein
MSTAQFRHKLAVLVCALLILSGVTLLIWAFTHLP